MKVMVVYCIVGSASGGAWLKRRASELRYTRLWDRATMVAMSRAASSFLSLMNDGLARMASLIILADWASPSAFTMIDRLSCSALCIHQSTLYTNHQSLHGSYLFHKELGTFSFLLGDLLRLDGSSVLLPKIQVSDWHIIQQNVEVSRSLHQPPSYKCWYLLSLCDQLWGIELGYHALQYLFT